MTPPIHCTPSFSWTSGHARRDESTLVSLWIEAIRAYEKETKRPFPQQHDFASIDDIYAHVEKSCKRFEEFRRNGAEWMHVLRLRIEPVALVIQTLSGALGDAVTLPFSPMKAVFGAISVVIEAGMKLREDFNNILGAFDTMEHYLRVISPLASPEMHESLRLDSVKLLAQVIKFLGVVTKAQQEGRMKLFLKKFAQAKEVKDALDELGRLANHHHQTVSAVTLHMVRELMIMFTDSWQDGRSESTSRSLELIKEIVRETHRLVTQTASSSMEQMLYHRQFLEHMQKSLCEAITAVKRQGESSDVSKIFRWLSFPDSSVRMNNVLDSRASGTGSWFLDSRELRSFQSGRVRALWLHGSAGSGKSTIMAMATRQIIAEAALRNEDHITLTHFFDATSGLLDGSLRELLSSLLCQLVGSDPKATNDLLKLYNAHHYGHSQPSLDTLRTQLNQLIFETSSRRIFIIIDALDEANDYAILDFLRGLRYRHEMVSFLISSRTGVPFRDDLLRFSDRTLAISTELVRGDIRILLNSILAGALAKLKSGDADFVRRTLSDRSEGNFRWTILQAKELEMVAGMPSLVRSRLQNMPRQLKDIYNHVAENIPGDLLHTVRRLLGWLLFTRKTLTQKEFAELLAFQFSDDYALPKFESELCPSSPDDLSAIVSSTFVSYRDEFVHIAHNSVRDYLLDSTSILHVDAHSAYVDMTQMCFSYLRFNHARPDPVIASTCAGSHPSSQHMDLHWVFYAAEIEGCGDEAISKRLRNGVFDLVSAVPPSLCSKYLKQAGQFDLAYVVHLLLSSGVDINGRRDGADTLLHRVAEHGSLALVRSLLSRGADVNAADKISLRTPLHLAVKLWRERVVEALLDAGAEPHARDHCGRTPLFDLELLRSHKDHGLRWAIARKLIEKGALRFPLDACGRHIHIQIALHVFRLTQDASAIRILKDHGVDLRARDSDGSSLLHYMAEDDLASTYHNAMAVLIRGKHVDVNACNETNTTPLHEAAKCNQEDVTRLLLSYGADPDICDAEGKDALWYSLVRTWKQWRDVPFFFSPSTSSSHAPFWSFENTRTSRVGLFKGFETDYELEHRGRSDDRDSRPDIETAAVILSAGAKVNNNVAAGTDTTVLHAALTATDKKVAMLLVNAGAEVNSRDGNGQTPLHHLLCLTIRRQEGAKRLWSRPGQRRTSTAISEPDHWQQDIHTALKLVQGGADVHIRDNQQRTVLHIAAEYDGKHHEQIVQSLISLGVQVNARDDAGLTALHIANMAVKKGKIASILIRAGANPSIRDNDGRAADLTLHQYPTLANALTVYDDLNSSPIRPSSGVEPAEVPPGSTNGQQPKIGDKRTRGSDDERCATSTGQRKRHERARLSTESQG